MAPERLSRRLHDSENEREVFLPGALRPLSSTFSAFKLDMSALVRLRSAVQEIFDNDHWTNNVGNFAPIQASSAINDAEEDVIKKIPISTMALRIRLLPGIYLALKEPLIAQLLHAFWASQYKSLIHQLRLFVYSWAFNQEKQYDHPSNQVFSKLLRVFVVELSSTNEYRTVTDGGSDQYLCYWKLKKVLNTFTSVDNVLAPTHFADHASRVALFEKSNMHTDHDVVLLCTSTASHLTSKEHESSKYIHFTTRTDSSSEENSSNLETCHGTLDKSRFHQDALPEEIVSNFMHRILRDPVKYKDPWFYENSINHADFPLDDSREQNIISDCATSYNGQTTPQSLADVQPKPHQIRLKHKSITSSSAEDDITTFLDRIISSDTHSESTPEISNTHQWKHTQLSRILPTVAEPHVSSVSSRYKLFSESFQSEIDAEEGIQHIVRDPPPISLPTPSDLSYMDTTEQRARREKINTETSLNAAQKTRSPELHTHELTRGGVSYHSTTRGNKYSRPDSIQDVFECIRNRSNGHQYVNEIRSRSQSFTRLDDQKVTSREQHDSDLVHHKLTEKHVVAGQSSDTCFLDNSNITQRRYLDEDDLMKDMHLNAASGRSSRVHPLNLESDDYDMFAHKLKNSGDCRRPSTITREHHTEAPYSFVANKEYSGSLQTTPAPSHISNKLDRMQREEFETLPDKLLKGYESSTSNKQCKLLGHSDDELFPTKFQQCPQQVAIQNICSNTVRCGTQHTRHAFENIETISSSNPGKCFRRRRLQLNDSGIARVKNILFGHPTKSSSASPNASSPGVISEDLDLIHHKLNLWRCFERTPTHVISSEDRSASQRVNNDASITTRAALILNSSHFDKSNQAYNDKKYEANRAHSPHQPGSCISPQKQNTSSSTDTCLPKSLSQRSLNTIYDDITEEEFSLNAGANDFLHNESLRRLQVDVSLCDGSTYKSQISPDNKILLILKPPQMISEARCDTQMCKQIEAHSVLRNMSRSRDAGSSKSQHDLFKPEALTAINSDIYMGSSETQTGQSHECGTSMVADEIQLSRLKEPKPHILLGETEASHKREPNEDTKSPEAALSTMPGTAVELSKIPSKQTIQLHSTHNNTNDSATRSHIASKNPTNNRADHISVTVVEKSLQSPMVFKRENDSNADQYSSVTPKYLQTEREFTENTRDTILQHESSPIMGTKVSTTETSGLRKPEHKTTALVVVANKTINENHPNIMSTCHESLAINELEMRDIRQSPSSTVTEMYNQKEFSKPIIKKARFYEPDVVDDLGSEDIFSHRMKMPRIYVLPKLDSTNRIESVQNVDSLKHLLEDTRGSFDAVDKEATTFTSESNHSAQPRSELPLQPDMHDLKSVFNVCRTYDGSAMRPKLANDQLLRQSRRVIIPKPLARCIDNWLLSPKKGNGN